MDANDTDVNHTENDTAHFIGVELGLLVRDLLRAHVDGRAVETTIENGFEHDIDQELLHGRATMRPTGATTYTFHVSHRPPQDLTSEDLVDLELKAFLEVWPRAADGPAAQLFKSVTRRAPVDIAFFAGYTEAVMVARKLDGTCALYHAHSDRELEATALLTAELRRGQPLVYPDSEGGFRICRWQDIEPEAV